MASIREDAGCFTVSWIKKPQEPEARLQLASAFSSLSLQGTRGQDPRGWGDVAVVFLPLFFFFFFLTLDCLLTTGDFFSPHRFGYPSSFNQDLPSTDWNGDGRERCGEGDGKSDSLLARRVLGWP